MSSRGKKGSGAAATKAMAKSKSKTGKGKLNCFNIIHKSIIIILDFVLTGDILIYKV